MRENIAAQEGRERVLVAIKEQNDIIDAQMVEIGSRVDGLDTMLSSAKGLSVAPTMVFSQRQSTASSTAAVATVLEEMEPVKEDARRSVATIPLGKLPPSVSEVETAQEELLPSALVVAKSPPL